MPEATERKVPTFLKVAIEHVAEMIESAISDSDPGQLNKLNRRFANVVNFLINTIPPEFLALSLNLLGEYIGNALAKRNAVAGMAVEEVSERIGIGLRNLAKRVKRGHKPTRQEIESTLTATAQKAHAVIPDMAPSPNPQSEEALTVWQTWSRAEVRALIGLFMAIDEEMSGDDTTARRAGDNNGKGLEGYAFRARHALGVLMKENPELVREYLPVFTANQKPCTEMQTHPYDLGWEIIRIAIEDYNTGVAGMWASVRDTLDCWFDRKILRYILRIFAGAGVLGTAFTIAVAVLIGLGMIAFVLLWEFGLLLLFIHAFGQLTHGLGVLDKPGFGQVFRLLWGSGWTLPPEMHDSYLWAGLLGFAVWRFLFTPPGTWFSWAGRQIAKINPFNPNNPISVPFRMLWAWIAFKTGASLYRLGRDHQNAQERATDPGQNVSWFRRIAITFNLIFIAIAAAWMFFYSLYAIMFAGYGFMYCALTMAAVGGLLLYFVLELTALVPAYWPFELRQSINHRTMWWLSRIGIIFLVMAILCSGALGLTRTFWTGVNDIDPNAPAQSDTSAHESPSLTPRQEATCAYERKHDKKLHRYCK